VILRIVRFRSGLSDEVVRSTMDARAPQFAAQPGLLQKYYVRFAQTGEYGAVYVWDSEQSLRDSTSRSSLERSPMPIR
jgi:hypothetical protein